MSYRALAGVSGTLPRTGKLLRITQKQCHNRILTCALARTETRAPPGDANTGLSILGLQESKLFAACTPFRRPKSFGGGQSSNARAPNCSRVCDNVSTRIFTCRAERLVAPLVCRASEPGTSHGPPQTLEARARTTPRRRRRKNDSEAPPPQEPRQKAPRGKRPAPARREYTMYS